MNQRIESLLAKAHLEVMEDLGVIETNVVAEKFAELIVKECLAQADKMRDGFEADGEAEQALGADWVALAIARHFGVEQ